MITKHLPRCHGLEIILITALLLASAVITTTLAVETADDVNLPLWWECSTAHATKPTETLIWLYRQRGQTPEKGLIKTRGVTYPTTFRFDGLESRWDWTTDDVAYAFLVGPAGRGQYHKLGQLHSLGAPRHIYNCYTEGTILKNH